MIPLKIHEEIPLPWEEISIHEINEGLRVDSCICLFLMSGERWQNSKCVGSLQVRGADPLHGPGGREPGETRSRGSEANGSNQKLRRIHEELKSQGDMFYLLFNFALGRP